MKFGKRLLALVLAITLVMSCGISTVLAADPSSARSDSGDSGAIGKLRIVGLRDKITIRVNGTMIAVGAGVTVERYDGKEWVTVPATFEYFIDEKQVATVDKNGTVTGVAAGRALLRIKATVEGKTKWEPLQIVVTEAGTYTVTFNTDGGTAIASVSVKDGEKVAKPNNPTKAGYAFVEWQYKGTKWDFSKAVTDDMELKAIWEKGSVSKKDLKDAIALDSQVEGKVMMSTDGDDVFERDQWTTPEKYTAYQAALKEAKAIDEKPDATQDEVDAAAKKLTNAFSGMNTRLGLRRYADKLVALNFHNDLGYISIDTTEADKLSDYVELINVENISGARVMFSRYEEDSAELYGAFSVKIDGVDRRNAYLRLQLNKGKTLSKSVYTVPIMVQFSDGTGAQTAVEVHINANDPAYIKTSKAVFTIADLDKPSNEELTSSDIVIKSPSGVEIKGVKMDNDETVYTVVDGKWDAEKKEYTFRLKATASPSGQFHLQRAEIYVDFASKARMAFFPAYVEIAIATSDAKLKEYINLGPESLAIGDESGATIDILTTKVAEETQMFAYGDVKKITNFKSEPANAITIEKGRWGGYSAFASAKGTATFDAVAEFRVSWMDGSPFMVVANEFIWNTTDATFSAPLNEEGASQNSISMRGILDINDLSTYTVRMDASFFDDKGAALEIENIALSANGKDNHLFKITKAPVKQQNGEYLFETTLQNVAETVDSEYFNLSFDVKAGGKQFQKSAVIRISAKDGGPKDVYFTKNGKKITSDTLIVDATGTKYGLVVEGYELIADDKLTLSTNDCYTIVRGNQFYAGMGTNEIVTIRMDKAVPSGTQVYVDPIVYFKNSLKVINPDVKLKMAEGVSKWDSFLGTGLKLASNQVSVDKTALVAAIDAATAAKKGIYISTDGSNIAKTDKWVTQAVMTAFERSITNAQAVIDDAEATADDITRAVDAMKKATADFVKAQKPGTKTSGGSTGDKPGDNTGGGSSGGSSSGSSSSGSTSTPSQPTSKEVNSDGSVNAADAAQAATSAIQNALASNSKNASVVIENAKSISAAAMKEIADAAKAAGGNVKLDFDTVVDGRTVARIVIDPAKAAVLGKDINLTVAVDEATTAPVTNHFNEFFANDIAAVSFAQAGAFGMTVDVAVRVDLSKIDLNKLQVYSYDRKTNKYVKVNPGKVFVDKNGFLHFQTNRGGDLLFSNGPLTAK